MKKETKPKMIPFKGKGEHSIHELEQIILQQEELLHERQISKQIMAATLTKIINWELPETGKFWDNDKTQPLSYTAEYGTEGVKEYIISLAQKSLADADNYSTLDQPNLMEGQIRKQIAIFSKYLYNMKENRAKECDFLSDKENDIFDQQIAMTAKFIRALQGFIPNSGTNIKRVYYSNQRLIRNPKIK